MKQRFYKLRHKPTGLFFKPVGATYPKNNFHKDGKIYATKPSIFKLDQQLWLVRGDRNMYTELKINEWEIVTFEAKEVKVEGCFG